MEKKTCTPQNIPILPDFTLGASVKDNVITQLINIVMAN